MLYGLETDVSVTAGTLVKSANENHSIQRDWDSDSVSDRDPQHHVSSLPFGHSAQEVAAL